MIVVVSSVAQGACWHATGIIALQQTKACYRHLQLGGRSRASLHVAGSSTLYIAAHVNCEGSKKYFLISHSTAL